MKNIIITLTLILTSSFAFAGDSGCGLGSVVIQKNSKVLQLFSMTTNATFFSQGFGITSGTSGCSASGLVINEKEVEYYVEVNQSDLTREMAQGKGEKLNTLAILAGCQGEAAKAQFAQFAKENFATIVPSADASSSNVVENLKNQMKNTNTCVAYN